MRLLIFVFFLSFLDTFAQTKRVSNVGMSINYNTLDLFFLTHYSTTFDKIECKLDLGFGINRTIFQQRFFPIVGISSTFYFLNHPKIQLGPTLSSQFSMLKINALENHFDKYRSLNVGYTFAYGTKLKLYQSTFFGYVNRRYFSTYLNDYNTVDSWKISAQIGLKYEI